MKIVYADFDGTLVRSNSFHYIYHCLWQKFLETRRPIDLAWCLVFCLGLPLFIVLHKCSDSLRDRVTYWFYKGMKPEEIETYARKYFHGRPELAYDATVQYLKVKKLEGYTVVIVSGSLLEIVRVAAQELGLFSAVDAYLTARLEYQNGTASGRVSGEPMVRSEKVSAIREYESGKPIAERICISDSVSDLPMLELTPHAIVVNPNPRLKRYAETKQWLVWQV